MAKTSRTRRPSTAKEKAPKTTSVDSVAGTAPGFAGPLVGIRLLAVSLRRLVYEEVESPDISEPVGGGTFPISVKLAGQFNMADDNLAEALMLLSLVPDPRDRALKIEATMSALFQHEEDVPQENVAVFLNHNAGRLLFPYMRELVTSITSRGIFESIHLEPWIIGPLVPDDEVRRGLGRTRE